MSASPSPSPSPLLLFFSLFSLLFTSLFFSLHFVLIFIFITGRNQLSTKPKWDLPTVRLSWTHYLFFRLFWFPRILLQNSIHTVIISLHLSSLSPSLPPFSLPPALLSLPPVFLSPSLFIVSKLDSLLGRRSMRTSWTFPWRQISFSYIVQINGMFKWYVGGKRWRGEGEGRWEEGWDDSFNPSPWLSCACIWFLMLLSGALENEWRLCIINCSGYQVLFLSTILLSPPSPPPPPSRSRPSLPLLTFTCRKDAEEDGNEDGRQLWAGPQASMLFLDAKNSINKVGLKCYLK